MPIEAINDAPTIYHAFLFALVIIVTAYFQGQTVVEVINIVLKEGIYPNIGFIVKSFMFFILIVASIYHSHISDDVIVTIGFMMALALVLWFTGEQATERLARAS